MLDNKTVLCCEIGSAHEGNHSLALLMIEEAAKTKCDAVKFQIYRAEELIHPTLMEVQFKRCQSLEFTEQQWIQLAEKARECGVKFFASAFGDFGLRILQEVNAPWIKIASGDLNHISFLRKVAKLRKPVILSTGMSTIQEVAQAIHILRDVPSLTLLHCMSLYPLNQDQAMLSSIQELREAFGLPVGYSDHVPGIETSLEAILWKIDFLEKHFTLTPDLKIGDHVHSTGPEGFLQLRESIDNQTEFVPKRLCTLPPGAFSVSQRPDWVNRTKWRRGVYTACDIPERKPFSEENLIFLRPQEEDCNGYHAIPADKYEFVLGKPSCRLHKGSSLFWEGE